VANVVALCAAEAFSMWFAETIDADVREIMAYAFLLGLCAAS